MEDGAPLAAAPRHAKRSLFSYGAGPRPKERGARNNKKERSPLKLIFKGGKLAARARADLGATAGLANHLHSSCARQLLVRLKNQKEPKRSRQQPGLGAGGAPKAEGALLCAALGGSKARKGPALLQLGRAPLLAGAGPLPVMRSVNYSNRRFSKWCAMLACCSFVGALVQHQSLGARRVTVTRAPFVFKKTREQFCLQKQLRRALLRPEGPAQKLLLIQCLGSARIPAEFEVVDC